MTDIETTVAGIPAILRVTYWEPYVPAQVSGPPENCWPAEGGYGDWDVLDRNGRPAPWLEAKITDAERRRLDRLVFKHMEDR